MIVFTKKRVAWLTVAAELRPLYLCSTWTFSAPPQKPNWRCQGYDLAHPERGVVVWGEGSNNSCLWSRIKLRSLTYLRAIGQRGWNNQQSLASFSHSNHPFIPALDGRPELTRAYNHKAAAAPYHNQLKMNTHRKYTLMTFPLPILNLKDLSDLALLSNSWEKQRARANN